MKKTVTIGTILTIISSALSYAAQIIVTEIVGFTGRGQIEVVISIIAIASAIFSFNTYTSLTLYSRKYRGEPFNIKKIFGITTAAQILGAMVLLYISFENLKGLNFKILAVVIVMAIVINNYANITMAQMSGIQKFISPKVATSFGLVLALISIMVLVKLNSTSVAIIIYFASILPLAFTGICISMLRSRYLVPKINVEFSLKRAFIDLWPVYVISVAQIAASRLFIIYVSNTSSIDKIGSFAFANTLMQLGLIPMTIVATIIISKRQNSQSGNHKLLSFFIYLLACIVGYGLIVSTIFENIPLQSFKSQSFIIDSKTLIWILPFNAIATIAIAEAVSKQRFSKILIITQCATLPIAIILYEICEMISLPNSIALAFTIATISVSFFCFRNQKT